MSLLITSDAKNSPTDTALKQLANLPFKICHFLSQHEQNVESMSFEGFKLGLG
jgi:hypothetical protein